MYLAVGYFCTSATREDPESVGGRRHRDALAGAASNELRASIALVARSCARFNLRTRVRTLLGFDVHGVVVEGSGGSRKRSR